MLYITKLVWHSEKIAHVAIPPAISDARCWSKNNPFAIYLIDSKQFFIEPILSNPFKVSYPEFNPLTDYFSTVTPKCNHKGFGFYIPTNIITILNLYKNKFMCINDLGFQYLTFELFKHAN